MKKVLVSVFALVALAACAQHYDYYKGGVQYTQDGADCIYYAGEQGRHYSNEIDGLNTNKKIVYRNTRCEDLYSRDMMGQTARNDRRVLAPATAPVAAPAPTCNACAAATTCVASDAPCKASAGQIVRRKYVIVPAM